MNLLILKIYFILAVITSNIFVDVMSDEITTVSSLENEQLIDELVEKMMDSLNDSYINSYEDNLNSSSGMISKILNVDEGKKRHK